MVRTPSLVTPPGTTSRPVPAEQVRDYPAPADGLPPLTDSPSALERAAATLAGGTGPVAVDAERASGFRYGQEAYLVQLRRARAGTVLVDPTTCGPTAPLAQALAGPEWILHAADQDLPCLAELGLHPARLFDTELAARLLGRARIGLGPVLEDTLGVRLAKDHAAADWSTRPLPSTWLTYASLDVELLIELRDALAAELDARGRTAWAEQEFEYERTRPPRQAKPDPWRHVPHAARASRSPRSLAVLREVWTAREELARQLDLTPSKVLPHAAVVAAAMVQPTSRRKLGAIKEFSSRQARLHMEVWWRAVERGLALPEDQLPSRRAPLAPGELPGPRTWERHHAEAARTLKVVRTAVRRRAEELEVPQELLLAPALQRRIAWDLGEERRLGGHPSVTTTALASRLETLGARPWQVELVSPVLAAALA